MHNGFLMIVNVFLHFLKLLRYLGYKKCHIKPNLIFYYSSNLPHKYYLKWWNTYSYRNKSVYSWPMYFFSFLEVKGLCQCLCYWNKSVMDAFIKIVSKSDVEASNSFFCFYFLAKKCNGLTLIALFFLLSNHVNFSGTS